MHDGLFTFNKIWKFQFEFIKNFNVEPVANWVDSNDTFSDKTVSLTVRSSMVMYLLKNHKKTKTGNQSYFIETYQQIIGQI